MTFADPHADVLEPPLSDLLELHSHPHTHWNREALNDPAADRRALNGWDSRVVSHRHVHVHFTGAHENGIRFLGAWHNALNAHDGSHVHEPDSYHVDEREEEGSPGRYEQTAREKHAAVR